jgi:DNA repair exonuclease SbcCD ATPase subunit
MDWSTIKAISKNRGLKGANPMTKDNQEKIQTIRNALQAATPGPWEVSRPDRDYNSQRITGKDDDGDNVPVCDVFLSISANVANEKYVEPDAHLIANAPEWLSYLLSELEAAKAEAEKWKEQAKVNHEISLSGFRSASDKRDEIETLQQQLDAAKQENERLRQIRYNATEAHLNVQTRLAEKMESLQQQLDAAKQEIERLLHRNESLFNEIEDYQQRLKQVEEALEWALPIVEHQSPTRAEMIRSLIRGEANKEENA